MDQTMPDGTDLSAAATGACRHLGDADHHRIWCVTQETHLNRFRRLEFLGWLVGWGEGVSGKRAHERGRTEVTLFLTVDGRIITDVNLSPGGVRLIPESPPDCWATFLGDHGSLESVEEWLGAIHKHVGKDAMAEEAGQKAIDRARGLLDRMSRTTGFEAEARRERAALLASSHAS
jgi:hypothetical protein